MRDWCYRTPKGHGKGASLNTVVHFAGAENSIGQKQVVK